MKLKTVISSLVGIGLLALSGQALASNPQYRITITNLTKGQLFTPVFAASVKRGTKLYKFGDVASDELGRVAEGGDASALALMLANAGKSYGTANGVGLIGPGESETLLLDGAHQFRKLILTAMMLPTNDGFFGVNGLALPRRGAKTFWLNALDAGSETNDEMFSSIPGPFGGEAFSPSDDGEGFVHVHNGIHNIADLAPAVYDWRNPVAKVVVKRIH